MEILNKLLKSKYLKNLTIFSKLRRFLIYKKKERLLLRNSYISEGLFRKFFKGDLKYEELRNIFFESGLFSYSQNNQKSFIKNSINRLCKEEKKDFIKIADKILQNELQIFEKKHKFSNGINWHFSFFDNYIWPLKKSEEMEIRPKLTEDKNIDVKYVWELNRHQFLPYLGFAYYIKGKEKYAIKFKDLILRWIKQNPPLFGVNWLFGLELSLRITSWIFSLWFFKDSKIINNTPFFKKVFKSMFQHAYYLKYFYTRNSYNHTVGDIFGIYFFSKIFEEVKPMNTWERLFFKKFKKQIFLQTKPDGVDVEKSINYHRFVLEFFILFLILNYKELNPKEKLRVQKMFKFLLYSIKPNGKFPNIGDADDAIVLPHLFTNNKKYRHLFNMGSILFKKGDLKYISKEIDTLSLLFFGNNGFIKYNKIIPEKPKKKLSIFDDTGYITLRNDWSDKANYLFIDFRNFGPNIAGHSHSDITNFIFCFNGKDLIVDSGTYAYNKSKKIRNFYKSSEAHNVISINSKNQADLLPWFGWKNLPKIRRNIEFNSENLDTYCIHEGYNDFLVKRRIQCPTDISDLNIIDTVSIRNKNYIKEAINVDLFFHFSKNVKINIENSKIILNTNIQLEISSNFKFKIQLYNSYYSTEYGEKISNKTLRINFKNICLNKKNLKIKTNFRLPS